MDRMTRSFMMIRSNARFVQSIRSMWQNNSTVSLGACNNGLMVSLAQMKIHLYLDSGHPV